MAPALSADLSKLVMSKPITLDANNHLYQCQIVKKTNTSAIYFVHDNELHYIPSMDVFNNIFNSAAMATLKTLPVLSLPIGAPLSGAQLYNNQKGTVTANA